MPRLKPGEEEEPPTHIHRNLQKGRNFGLFPHLVFRHVQEWTSVNYHLNFIIQAAELTPVVGLFLPFHIIVEWEFVLRIVFLHAADRQGVADIVALGDNNATTDKCFGQCCIASSAVGQLNIEILAGGIVSG